MEKIIRFFKAQQDEFLRLFLFDNSIELIHFKLSNILNKYAYAFDNKEKLLSVCKDLNLPIELIIHHRSMSCHSFISNDLSTSDTNNLVRNSLNNNLINTVFYSNYKTKNGTIVNLCECDLTKEMTHVFQEILTNKIISISVFPYWVISSFFQAYQEDTNKFKTSIFMVEYLNCWNIIVLNNNHIIYNRSGYLNNVDKSIDFDKSIEMKNTINHINNIYNIELNDIGIYEFGPETINSLTMCLNSKMKVISNINPLKSQEKHIIIENFFKLACSSCIVLLMINTIVNAYQIHNLKNEKQAMQNYINKCNQNVINDLDIWKDLYNKNLLNQPNYEQALETYMKDQVHSINNIYMQLDNNTQVINCSEDNINE